MTAAAFLKAESVRVAQLPDGIARSVLLTAEHIFGEHPEWTVSGVYSEIIKAIGGRTRYTPFWRLACGKPMVEETPAAVEEAVPF